MLNRKNKEEYMPAGTQTEKLVQDIKTVVRDAEELLRATGNDLNEKTQEARRRLAETLETARTSCQGGGGAFAGGFERNGPVDPGASV